MADCASQVGIDNSIKTVGGIADKNREKMSDDEKIALYCKHNQYKHEYPDRPLPNGMERGKRLPIEEIARDRI